MQKYKIFPIPPNKNHKKSKNVIFSSLKFAYIKKKLYLSCRNKNNNKSHSTMTTLATINQQGINTMVVDNQDWRGRAPLCIQKLGVFK